MPEPLSCIIDFLHAFAPLELAESWDNVGLLVGNRDANVSRIITCLTLTPDVAEEAIAAEAELIVAHHPVLFRPIQKLTSQTSEGRMLLKLIQAGIQIFSPHTAFDNARLGINQLLAESLGLQNVQPLKPHLNADTAGLGAGRHGSLPTAVPLREFLELVQTTLSIPAVPYVGSLEQRISHVAVACGAAGEFLKDALAAKCDLFLTGETRFHTCLEARDQEIALILAGHYATERPGVERLAEVLAQNFPLLTVWASRNERDPISWNL